jgi:hypothetical protein
MTFNPIETELTTAATDAVIAVVALACIVLLRRHRGARPFRVATWVGVFGLLAVASALGAVAHGFDLAESTQTWLWRPLYLSLGLVVALFVVGAVLDFRGADAARRLLWPMLSLGVAFFLLTQFASGAFLVFVIYEGVAMVAALVMYSVLAARRTLPGAATIAAGIVLNLVAAAVQAIDSIQLTIVVTFDHNGVFHLVQIVALVVMLAGLLKGMRSARGQGTVSAG